MAPKPTTETDDTGDKRSRVAAVGASVAAAGAAAGAQVAAVARTGAGVARTGAGLGEYLKEQRLASRLSLRQLSELAGVSNPYLSQIERGLRKPSAEVLQQLAKALRISAEQLYVQAGLISPDSPAAPGSGPSFEAAVLADTRLTSKQRQTLLDVHASFIAMNATEQPR